MPKTRPRSTNKAQWSSEKRDEKRDDNEDDNAEDATNTCLICSEFGRNNEIWYRCTLCGQWAHAECTGWDSPEGYVCDNCWKWGECRLTLIVLHADYNYPHIRAMVVKVNPFRKCNYNQSMIPNIKKTFQTDSWLIIVCKQSILIKVYINDLLFFSNLA